MKKWLVVLAAFLVIGIPAAYAASSGNDKPAQAQSAADNAAKTCKAERASMGVEAFRKKYGTNHNLMNAFGKCVSAKSKDKANKDDEKDEKDEKDDDNEAQDNGAKKCKAERSAMGVEAFAKKYGTNHNLKNAFGKCVSSLSKAKNKDD
jgi:flagellar hook assembly protein FlgD